MFSLVLFTGGGGRAEGYCGPGHPVLVGGGGGGSGCTLV